MVDMRLHMAIGLVLLAVVELSKMEVSYSIKSSDVVSYLAIASSFNVRC